MHVVIGNASNYYVSDTASSYSHIDIQIHQHTRM